VSGVLVRLLAGALFYPRLGRNEDPAFTFRTMVVQAGWPGATLERDGAGHRAREILRQRALEPAAQALAGRDVLCDDDELTEEVVRQLDIERQIKPDGAASDIRAPSLDIGILLEDAVELRRHIVARIDRSILRQPQIDQQLRSVRGRKELSWYVRGADQGQAEARDRQKNGNPAVAHGDEEDAAKDAQNRARLRRLRRLWLRQKRHPEKRNENDRDQPGCKDGDADHGEDREGVFAGRASGKT